MTNEKKKRRKAPETSPFGRKLYNDLVEAGAGGLEPSKLKITGAERELKGLSKLGYAVSLGGTVYLSIEAYEDLAGAILRGRKTGDMISIADARESTSLSRKYLLPILNRMESDGYVKRTGDVRIILAHRPGDDKQPSGGGAYDGQQSG